MLRPGETCMLYTDGLTEARNKDGELFGEERLEKLFAAWPTAKEAAEAAIKFGQDDDVTVLSFTRLKTEAAAPNYPTPTPIGRPLNPGKLPPWQSASRLEDGRNLG